MKKKRTVVVVIAGMVFCLGALASLGMLVSGEGEAAIAGVKFMGADLSGMSEEMVAKEVHRLEKDVFQTTRVVLRCGEKSWSYLPAELGIALDMEKVKSEALKTGREGSVIRRLRQWSRARGEGISIPVYVTINKTLLEDELDRLNRQVSPTPPVDASFKINPDETVEVVPARDGVGIDTEKAIVDIAAAFAGQQGNVVVDLALVPAAPRRTTREAVDMGINGLLASYSTTFDPRLVDRSANIRVAAGALDGKIVAPSEVFSFNGTIGSRSTEAGYRNAKIIVNNEYVDGLGGGICQLTSTLYNAVILANLEILDRKNHSLPVSYVPAGRDATVSYNYIDFKFRNSTPNHIYIKTYYMPGRIAVKIYGNKDYRREITVNTRVLEKIPFKDEYKRDPTLGEREIKLVRKGIPGMRVAAEKLIMENGGVKRESLPSSIYYPVDRIIAVGADVETPVRIPLLDQNMTGLGDAVDVPDVPESGPEIKTGTQDRTQSPGGEGNRAQNSGDIIPPD
ncbi:MAG: VanW family protein [Bacillota bacterium]